MRIDEWIRPQTVLLFLILVGVVWTATAAPKVGSQDECLLYADFALTTGAMAKNGIANAKADQVLDDIYAFSAPTAAEMTDSIRKSVRAFVAGGGSHREYAVGFLQTCVSLRGNVDSILGTSI